MGDYRYKLMCEIHGNISAANFYFDLTIPRNTGFFVVYPTIIMHIFKNEIWIENSNRRTKVKLTTSLNDLFIPASFHSQKGNLKKLQKSDEKVEVEYKCDRVMPVFRLQINPDSVFPSNELENSSPINNLLTSHLLPDTSYLIACNSCQKQLVDEPILFTKVANLPFNLTELFENLVCHAHDANEMFQVIVQPAQEMYLTPTCYVLNCLNPEYLLIDDAMVKCKKCSSIICNSQRKSSNRLKDSLFCFKDKITFTSVGQSPSHILNDGVNIALDTLLCLIRDTLETSVVCKLYLQEKALLTQDYDCLLIWVVDHNMKRFVTEPCQLTADFQKDIQFESVVKVLYCSCSRSTDLARSWASDFSVDIHYVSDTMLKEITKYLNESMFNCQFASSAYAHGFLVGYLPLKS